MQVRLQGPIGSTGGGRSAAEIIRACVHCGFCNATCPTYQLLGDELDGPRGRIYQIKDLLEGGRPTSNIQKHLDRCLTCRACETTCPSGVQYGILLDFGRGVVEKEVTRPLGQRVLRHVLRFWLPYPERLRPFYRLAHKMKAVLPSSLKVILGAGEKKHSWPKSRHRRRMVVLDGCVQNLVAFHINQSAARVFDRLGISLIQVPEAGCCGALSYHLGAHREGLEFMRRNIDAWWPHVEAGVEAIVVTASGCGVTVKEYGRLLADDPDYAGKARKISTLARDPAEILAGEDLTGLKVIRPTRVAFQSPCTLQHGLRLKGVVESILQELGFELTPVTDSHLCCGSAGTYSILQAGLARQLRNNKVTALEAGDPDIIASANIGCMLHLAPVTRQPVQHWLELLDFQGRAAGRVKT